MLLNLYVEEALASYVPDALQMPSEPPGEHRLELAALTPRSLLPVSSESWNGCGGVPSSMLQK